MHIHLQVEWTMKIVYVIYNLPISFLLIWAILQITNYYLFISYSYKIKYLTALSWINKYRVHTSIMNSVYGRHTNLNIKTLNMGEFGEKRDGSKRVSLIVFHKKHHRVQKFSGRGVIFRYYMCQSGTISLPKIQVLLWTHTWQHSTD